MPKYGLPSLFLMRGLPGCGKSTAARRIAAALTHGRVNLATIVSNDDYQMRWDGDVARYDFDAAFARQAHASCFRDYLEALQRSVPLIIVDNTNTHPVQIIPYLLAADAYCRKATVLELSCTVEVSAARNTHSVPLSAINKMADNLGQPFGLSCAREFLQTEEDFLKVFGEAPVTDRGAHPS